MRFSAILLILAVLSPAWAVNEPVPDPARGNDKPNRPAADQVPTPPPAVAPATPPAPDGTTPTAEPTMPPATPAAGAVQGDSGKAAKVKPGKSGAKLFGPGMTRKKTENWGQPDIKISVWKYITSMLVVLVLIFVFFFGLRRVSMKIGGAGYGSLNVSQRLQLDGKNSLVLVRFHEEEILVAVGPNGTNLISRVAALEGTEADEDEGDIATGNDGLETKHVTDDQSQPFLAKLLGGKKKLEGSQ